MSETFRHRTGAGGVLVCDEAAFASEPVEVSALRPHGASRFVPTVEAMLHPVLRDLAVRLPGAVRGCVLFEEFRGPWGVPDLAALIASPESIDARHDCGVPPLLSEKDCVVVAQASRWTDPKGLGLDVGSSGGTVRRRLSRLMRCGALQRNSRGLVRVAPGLAPMGRLWALEAKVDSWRVGLAQAHRYRLWADGAVLALQRARVERARLAAEAECFRVAVWTEGGWVRRPRLVVPSPARRLWASEHAAAALWGDDDSSVVPDQYPSSRA